MEHVSSPFMCDLSIREERALENMQTAIDMKEIFERVSIKNTKSFLPHAATHKVTRDILNVGDVWATDLSALELQNAETKRVAEHSAAKRLEMSSSGQTRRGLQIGEGPAQLIKTKGYSTTVALSVLNHLLMQDVLRRGDGLHKVPDARRTERLFYQGRTKLVSQGIKLEKLGVEGDYLPEEDTCIAAFIRLLAAASSDRASAA